MAKNILYLQIFTAGDGNRGAIYGDGCHLDDENVILPVAIGDHITHSQSGELLIGIFDNICSRFVVRRRHSIDTLYALDDLRSLGIDRKVGVFAFVQVQHQLRVIVVDCRGQQFLHLLGVHRGVVAGAQRRQVIGIHQIGRG